MNPLFNYAYKIKTPNEGMFWRAADLMQAEGFGKTWYSDEKYGLVAVYGTIDQIPRIGFVSDYAGFEDIAAKEVFINSFGLFETLEKSVEFFEEGPTGLRPEFIVKEQRVVEILETMMRYATHNPPKVFPIIWVDELTKLNLELSNL